MKKTLLILLALATANCFAQKDPEAKKVLDKAASNVQSYKNISIDFDYQFENLAEEKNENYSGSLIIKGNKFRMDVDNTTTFCDGKCRWVYLPESNEVTISPIELSDDDAPEEKFLSDPMSLYTIYREGFKYLLNDNETIDGKTMLVVELAPENIKKPYFKIRYWFTQDYNLYKIKCFQKDGTRYTLTLSKFDVNQKIDESQLNFDAKKHPGVEIIDMRD